MELHIDEKRLLKIFQDNNRDEFNLNELEKFMPKEKILRVSLWLKGKNLVETEEKVKKIIKLIKEEEFPERKIANYLKQHNIKEIEIKNLKDILPKEEINAALGAIKRKGIARIEKGKIIFDNLDYKDVEEQLLQKIKENKYLDDFSEEEKKIIDILKKRGYVDFDEEKEIKIKLTEKGKEFIKNPIEIEEEITQLTRDIIISGKWKKHI